MNQRGHLNKDQHKSKTLHASHNSEPTSSNAQSVDPNVINAVRNPTQSILTPKLVAELGKRYGNAFVQRLVKNSQLPSEIPLKSNTPDLGVSRSGSENAKVIQRDIVIENDPGKGTYASVDEATTGLKEILVGITDLPKKSELLKMLDKWAKGEERSFTSWNAAVAAAFEMVDKERKEKEEQKAKEEQEKVLKLMQELIQKGKERFALMLTANPEKKAKNLKDEITYSQKGYSYDPVEAKDWQESYATKYNLDAEVKVVKSAGSLYIVTPVPKQQLLLIGYYNRREKEEAPASEVLYQIYKDASGSGQIPPLLSLYQSQVASADTGAKAMNFITKGSTQFQGTFTPENDEFYAMLGIENGAAAVFLVRDRGAELGISGIHHIEIKGQDATYHFSPVK